MMLGQFYWGTLLFLKTIFQYLIQDLQLCLLMKGEFKDIDTVRTGKELRACLKFLKED